MPSRQTNRRTFLKRGVTAAASAAAVPYYFSGERAAAQDAASANDRPMIGAIGVGGRGSGIARGAARYGDIVAVCDVDRAHAERFQNATSPKADLYEEYRKLLDRQDIDIVTIGTPDHWHTKIAIDAMRSGKDVYCEKPLTLTIDEGKKLCKVTEETGRVFQIGTQQRSDYRGDFLTAVAMCHLGRIGKIKHVQCAIGGGPSGGPFEKAAPPAGLNWDMWLGQAPLVDYIPQRCHRSFRWWYEYSGGKLTDWGAHHVDIAQWAIGAHESGPAKVAPVSAEHAQVLDAHGMPTRDDCYNTATRFLIECRFPGDIKMTIRSDTDNGILFEGEKGRFFVNRGKLVGAPVEALADTPIPEDYLVELRKGKEANNHMGNFIACCRDRGTPISDVWSHHRALSTCHLAGIAIRLNRELNWDAAAEQIVGDDEANSFLARKQRKGYEIEA